MLIPNASLVDVWGNAFSSITSGSTTSASFATIQSVTITSSARNLIVWASQTTTTGAVATGTFQLLVDGNAVRGWQADHSIEISALATGIGYYAASVGGGSHTIAVQWKTSASTLTLVSASLLVAEVG